MDYKRVIEDFNNGTIDPAKFLVVMDNDGGYWLCVNDSIDDEDKREELAEVMKKKYGSPGGYNDIVDVLNGSGVNAEWC